ncbi:MAG: pyruvate kinase [Patescibacteria group bacterium]
MSNSKAQIIATIGPKSGTVELLSKMLKSGLDVVRLNFSWGTYDEHRSYITNTRAAAQEIGRHIPIIQDLSGPRVQQTGGHAFDADAQLVAGVLTEKDLRDLEFGLAEQVEYIALSYVGNARDIDELRRKLPTGTYTPKIIAKIERQEALDNLDEIIESSDAIMIARGDLGQNIPIEQVPFVERRIIMKTSAAKKPVITATQMMLSMVDHPEPTRAEVTDVAFAILLGSDAVMLSEETARGKYPVEAVAIMEKILVEAESYVPGSLERHTL